MPKNELAVKLEEAQMEVATTQGAYEKASQTVSESSIVYITSKYTDEIDQLIAVINKARDAWVAASSAQRGLKLAQIAWERARDVAVKKEEEARGRAKEADAQVDQAVQEAEDLAVNWYND